MLHNEPEVIKQSPRDCVHTFIHFWNHKGTRKYGKMGTQTQIKRASVCQKQGRRQLADTVQPLHKHAHLFRSTCTQSTCTHEYTRLYNALGTSHISHFTLYRPYSKRINRSSEPTLKASFCETPAFDQLPTRVGSTEAESRTGVKTAKLWFLPLVATTTVAELHRCQPFHFFQNPPPPKCAAKITTASNLAIQLAAEH